MSFLSGLTNILTGGISGTIAPNWGHNQKKTDPYAALLEQLNPLIQAQTKIATDQSNAGITNVDKATGDYDYVANYLKSLFSGSDDQLLSLLDASGATTNLDENFQQAGELGVRGGQRAASLGQAGFNKDAMLNKLLSQLRFAAPDKLAGIAQGIGNLGLGELGSSTSASNSAVQPIFGIEDLKQKDKDRHAAMISSIFSAIGSSAGALAAMCVSIGDSFIATPSGKVPISRIEVGDKVLSFDKETGEQVIRTVIRVRDSEEKQIVRVIEQGSRKIRPTKSHVFYDGNFDKLICGDLVDDDLLFVAHGKTHNIIAKSIKILGEEESIVRILKLDNEEECFVLIINDFMCEDDDPIVEVK